MYSTDPAHDATRHHDELDRRLDDLEERRKEKTAEIVKAFTADTIELGPENVPLPFPRDARGMPQAQRFVLTEATDLILDDKLLPIFGEILRNSDCPHVAQLRQAMGEEYARMWVDDLIAEEEP